MAKLILVLALGIFALVNRVDADCKICTAANYAACFNSTAFYICFDGKNPSNQIGVCKPGEVCTTQAGVCQPAATGTADCKDKCGTCSGAFACVSKTEFVTCDGAGKPGTVAIPCPDNQFCNIDAFADANKKTICVKNCDNEPTCSNDVVKEPDPSEGLQKSCTTKDTGTFPNLGDPSCKTYVFCQTLDDTLYALLYTCPNGYYNKEQKECVATKPSYCT